MPPLDELLRKAIALEANRTRLESLSAALIELLRAKSALEAAEARARKALRGEQTLASGMTLHEAMASVLRDRGAPMTRRELTEEVNRRRLYRQRDGSPLPIGQTSARVHNYPHIFKRGSDGRIGLREWDTAVPGEEDGPR